MRRLVLPTVLSSGTAKVGKSTVIEDTITLNQRCVGPPQDRCSMLYLVNEKEYITGFPGAKARAAAARRQRTVVVGRLAVTLRGGESRKVRIRLNAAGRKRLAKRGRLTPTLVVSQKLANGKTKTVKRIRVTFKAKKRR